MNLTGGGYSQAQSCIDSCITAANCGGISSCLKSIAPCAPASDDLNRRARCAMAVLHSLKLAIDNRPVGQVEEVEFQNNPPPAPVRCRSRARSNSGRTTFRDVPPPKYYRLPPGKEVRRRQSHGGALYLRPRQPRRQLFPWMQNEGQHALRLCRARDFGGNPLLRQTLP